MVQLSATFDPDNHLKTGLEIEWPCHFENQKSIFMCFNGSGIGTFTVYDL
jgi:hypothetical protein